MYSGNDEYLLRLAVEEAEGSLEEAIWQQDNAAIAVSFRAVEALRERLAAITASDDDDGDQWDAFLDDEDW